MRRASELIFDDSFLIHLFAAPGMSQALCNLPFVDAYIMAVLTFQKFVVEWPAVRVAVSLGPTHVIKVLERDSRESLGKHWVHLCQIFIWRDDWSGFPLLLFPCQI